VRIAVVGAGALGGAFGAGFTRAGHDVTLIDVSRELVDLLNANGLTVLAGGAETTVAVRASAEAARVGPVDLVTVFVKTHQTLDAAAAITPLVGPDTVLATLQNGLGSADELAARQPRARVVAGVTYHSATVLAPGRVRHATGPTFAGPHARAGVVDAERLTAVCADAGWPAQAMPDAGPAIWRKLLLNSTNAVSALSGLPGAAQLAQEQLRELLRSTIAETLTVAHALGHTGLDLEEAVREMEEVLARAGEGRASMLQDFDAGRRTEVDALNGAIVREAQRLGVDVPINRTLLALVKGWERARGLG
jgi:2-dehydropantoate 2-reductase